MSLKPTGFIALPGATPTGFDHADTYVDRTGSRLYVAHTATNAVDVIDCRSNAFLRSLPDLPGVAGALIDTEHDLLFTSDRGAARVTPVDRGSRRCDRVISHECLPADLG